VKIAQKAPIPDLGLEWGVFYLYFSQKSENFLKNPIDISKIYDIIILALYHTEC